MNIKKNYWIENWISLWKAPLEEQHIRTVGYNMDIQNKIDWKFIGELEGDSIYGSVPTENSGVTIGMGFDLKEKD